MRRLQRRFLPCFLLLFLSLFLVLASSVHDFLMQGLLFCGRVLLPALFPFLVLSNLLCIYRPSTSVLPKPLRRFFSLTGLSDPTPFFLGLLCGFPIGARYLYSLYCAGALSKERAERLLAPCTACSPAFLYLAIGQGIFGQARAGWILLFAQGISALLLLPYGQAVGEERAHEESVAPPLSLALSGAIREASLAALSLCGTVLFFSAFCACIWEGAVRLALPTSVCALLCGFFELTAGVRLLSASAPYALCLFGFLCGFGGVCVAMQVRVASEGRLSLRPYFAKKLLQGLLCSALCAIGCILFS